jgi:hypothetical protein
MLWCTSNWHPFCNNTLSLHKIFSSDHLKPSMFPLTSPTFQNTAQLLVDQRTLYVSLKKHGPELPASFSPVSQGPVRRCRFQLLKSTSSNMLHRNNRAGYFVHFNLDFIVIFNERNRYHRTGHLATFSRQLVTP